MSEAIVVAHGLWMPGTETWLMRRRFEAHGYRAHAFRYSTLGDGLNHNAELLSRYISKLDAGVVHLVGYSLGGIISAHMLRTLNPPRIGRLVCLGSPLKGSVTAAALLRLPGGGRLLGQSMSEIVAAGGFAPWNEPVEIGVVAGNISLGLGRILGALDGPNDGTVAVAETRLDGIADHIVRPVSHTTMLFSAQVAEDAVNFLRSGRF